MTTVAVLADPPRDGFVLPELAESSLLSPGEARNLYLAMLGDVCRAVEESGGDLLVNYRPDDQVPSGDLPSEDTIHEALEPVLERPDQARYEVQVGSSLAARVGNTVTHLLEREGVDTAAVVEPTAPFLARQHVDSAAMKLRSSEVVLGPGTRGRVHYAGFAEPIDFEDAFATPALETLTTRAGDAGLSVDFLPTLPVLERPEDLLTAVPLLRSRREAGRLVPELTAATVADFGLRVVADEDGDPTVVRE